MSVRPADPLKITLTRPWRVMIMTSLILAFFIISPIIILYTGGWRWNFTTWQLEATGVLSVDTEPDDAEVYLNNQLISTKQPLRLSSLAPGNYRVSISKAGYHTFSTDVTVRSHETTYIRNTTLFAINFPQFVTSTTGKIGELGIVGVNPLSVRFAETASTTNLVTVKNNEVHTFPIPANAALTCAKTKTFCAFWENKDNLNVVNVSTNEQRTIKIKTNTVQWNENERNPVLYALDNTTVVSLNTNFSTKKLTTVSSSVWYVDPSEKVWSSVSSTLVSGQGNDQVIITSPNNVTTIVALKNNYALLKTPYNLAIMNALYSSPNVATLSDYDHYEYHAATAEWRLWSKWEVSSLYDGSGDRAILYRSAEPIDFVKALEPAGVLLIVQNNKLMAFNPGYYASQELATFDAISDLTTDEENRLIVVAGSREGKTGLFTLAY